MDEFVRDAHNEAHYGGDYDGDDSLEFSVSLAQIASAIKAHGDGSGGRLTFDVPESDKAALSWALLRCPGHELSLRVTIKGGRND